MKQHTKLVLGLVTLIALAGCTGSIPGLGAGDPIEYVPHDAEMVVHVDMAVMEDGDTRTLTDALAAEDPTVDDTDEAVAEFEDETGLDPHQLRDVVMFATPIEEAEQFGPQTHTAVILYSDWSEDEFVEAVEEDEMYEFIPTEHNGVTVYEPDVPEDYFGTPTYVAALGDGEFIVGEEDAVLAAVDVSAGDLNGLDGEMRSAFEDVRDGYVTFVANVDEEHIPSDQAIQQIDPSAFEDVSVIAGSYGTSSGALAVEMMLYTNSESSAQDVADVTDGGLALLRGTTPDDDLKEQLEGITIEQDGTVVTIIYEADVDDLVELIESAA